MDRRSLQRRLKALGGSTRLAIVAYLKEHRSASVSDIAYVIRRSINTTSIHLSHLERLDIIKRSQRGRTVTYRLSFPPDPVVRQVFRVL